jgi:hypothetical protein
MIFHIKILVFAPDSESAQLEALRVIHKKWEEGVYDWAVDFSEDGYQKHYGKNKLASTPAVLQVSTARFPTDDKRGVEMANEAMEHNRKMFKENMAIIRQEIADYTDDQIFEGQCKSEIPYGNPSKFRNQCQYVGEDIQDPFVRLYDFLGQGITSPLVLQRILTDTDSHPWFIYGGEKYEIILVRQLWNQPLWIVPYLAHY